MPVGFSDGTSFADKEVWMAAAIDSRTVKQRADAAEMAANERSGDFQSRFYAADTTPASGIAPEDLRKATGAFFTESGTQTPVEVGNINLRNRPSVKNQEKMYGPPDVGAPLIPNGGEFSPGLPFFNNLVKSWKRPEFSEGETLFETPTGLKITEGDLSKVFDVGLAFSGGGLGTSFKPVKVSATLEEIGVKKWSDGSRYLYKDSGGNYHTWKINPEGKGDVSPTSVPTKTAEKWIEEPVQVPFTDIENIQGFEIDLFKLSNKQFEELGSLKSNYKHGLITHGEYISELKEYHEYTKPNGTYDRLKTVPGTSQYETYLSAKAKELAAKYEAEYADMFKDVEKLSPKEAFRRGVEEIAKKLAVGMADIKAKFINSVKEYKLEQPAPTPPEIAIEKGFDTPAYRGLVVRNPSGMPDPVYDPVKGSGELYSTPSQRLADMYSSYLDKHPGYQVSEGVFTEGAQVMPLYLNTKEYHVYDAKGKHWSDANREAIREAIQQNKPGVIVKNVWDEPNGTLNLGAPQTVFITLPKGLGTVKSRFAERFDISSPNVMHSVGGIGIGSAATGYVTLRPDDL